LGWYVIVVPATIDEPGITSRIEQYEDRPEIGLVVSVGENVEEIDKGNVVFFGKYSTVQMTHDDTTYIILREDDVYCVAE
jgi:co-chaperonin GroES (HSP10)